MATQKRIISPYSKTKDYCFLKIKKCVTHFSSKLDTTCSSNQAVLFQITFRTSLLLKQ